MLMFGDACLSHQHNHMDPAWKDNKGWTKAERANRWVIIPSFIIPAYGELFSSTEFSGEQSPGKLYAVNIMGLFLSICFCVQRGGKMIFLPKIVEKIFSIKDLMMFVAINSMRRESGSPSQPDSLYHGSELA